MYLLIYVDDMFIPSCDRSQITKLKSELSSKFELKNLGCAKQFLGMEIIRDREKIMLFLSQDGYCKKMQKCLFENTNANY